MRDLQEHLTTTNEEIMRDEPSEPTELAILPLPVGGTVTPRTALAWLRDDFQHFHTVAWNVGAEGPTQDIRNAAALLSLDLGMAHKACIRVIETEMPQAFERDDDPKEWDIRTLYLARVCAARHVMSHSTGPFEWAFNELAEELVRRLESRL